MSTIEQPTLQVVNFEEYLQKVEIRLKQQDCERRGQCMMNLLYVLRQDIYEKVEIADNLADSNKKTKGFGPDIFGIPDDFLLSSPKYKVFIEIVQPAFLVPECKNSV